MSDRIDRSLPTPLYHQLERILRSDIESGAYRAGDLLPSESEICERYDVSRSVVRQTLANLAHAGVVHTERGRGSFVAERKFHERFVQRATGFYDDLSRMGFALRTKVVRQEICELPLQVREFLDSETGIRIDRVRSVEGRVLAYVTTYVSPRRCPGLERQDLNDRSLYEHLDRVYGLQVHGGRRTVEAVAATPEIAGHLDVAPGTPLLLLRSASRTADGAPLEWFEAWHRADRTMFEIEIVPGESVHPFLGVVRGASDDDTLRTDVARPARFNWDSTLGGTLRADRVVAVLRAPHYGAPDRLAHGLVRGGVRIIEFTLTGDNALDAVRAARDVPEAVVGVGSVLTPDDARRAVAAGAAFLVCPVWAPEIVAAAGRTPVLLAGRTPTELYRAWSLTGAPVKLFPAHLDGPGYVRALLAPMPDLALMPSGGVDAGNVGDYLRAGAVAVNVGGALCPEDLLTAGDADELTRRARQLRAAIDAVP
ncbi:MAG TPA: UTRA domain-containing protein [Euzebyales bacterium]|nr:UTRA domain-containing protein [Euzebyales bacterium]